MRSSDVTLFNAFSPGTCASSPSLELGFKVYTNKEQGVSQPATNDAAETETRKGQGKGGIETVVALTIENYWTPIGVQRPNGSQ
jgi:hypothetical protein